MMLNTNPTVDIREKFDTLYHVKSAEWQGFYPSDLSGQTEAVSDEYKDLIHQVCKRRNDILRAQGKEPMWEIEIDPKEYAAAKMELANQMLRVKLEFEQQQKL